MKNLLFVYNPLSGKGQIKNYLAEIIDIFTKGGYIVTARPTQSRDDAYLIMKECASQYDLVVCSGGDGTMNETIRGIISGGHHIPVGYIPAGTFNDFASSLGISKLMPDAARSIMTGTAEYIDVGAFNDRYFTYVAAFGAFTKISYATDQQLKNSLGPLAYIIEAMRNSDLDQKYSINIQGKDKKISGEFIFGMVANSLSVGGIKDLAGKDVSLNDGLFEGVFIRSPSSLAEFHQILNALLRHDFSSSSIVYFKADNFKITSDTELPWTVDGEYGGSFKETILCPLHNVFKVIVDKSKANGLCNN